MKNYIEAMKAAALAATQGDWEMNRHGVIIGGPVMHYVNGSSRNQIALTTVAEWMSEGEPMRNALHIVRSNPATVLALIERLEAAERALVVQANAARMGMDAAKANGAEMERNARAMLAQSDPEALASERAANAMLTEQVERLTKGRQVKDPDLGVIDVSAAYHSLSGRHKAALSEIAELRERLERNEAELHRINKREML